MIYGSLIISSNSKTGESFAIPGMEYWSVVKRDVQKVWCCSVPSRSRFGTRREDRRQTGNGQTLKSLQLSSLSHSEE
jgi:hypothetical protein